MLPGLRILLVLPKCVRKVLVKPGNYPMNWQLHRKNCVLVRLDKSIQLKERKKQPHPSLTCLLSQMLSMVRAPVSDCGVDFHLPSLRSPPLAPSGSPSPSHPLSAYRRRPASAALGLFFLLFPLFLLVILFCSLFQLFAFFLSLIATSP